jgi:putative transposase
VSYRVSKRAGGNKLILRIYNSGYNGKSIFRTSADYNKFLSILARLSRGTPAVSILGFVLMRNHFYLIVEESVRGESSKFLHKLSVSYAMYFQFRYQHTGKIFKGPYEDSIITDEEDAMLALSKMHRLPEGLNIDIESYSWSSYRKYIHNQAPWLDKHLVVDYFKTPDYLEALKDFTLTVALDK